MPFKTPTKSTWSELYQTAQQFKDLKPWEWMEDSDLFGVMNPDTGEIGYCCIMGMLGEVFGMAVYRGTESLKVYHRIQSGDIPEDPNEILRIQNCLVVSFEDRSELDKRDLKVIKDLGLKFRGRNTWPMFRSYTPGYLPWYLTEGEARFLIYILEQTINVAKRVRSNPTLIKSRVKGSYFVRVLEQQGEKITWEDKWLEPETSDAPVKLFIPLDDKRIKAIKSKTQTRKGILEFDCFMGPFVIQEGERPYFPSVCLWIDKESFFILRNQLVKGRDDWTDIYEEFMKLFEQMDWLPAEIHVTKNEALQILEPLCDKLDIKLYEVNVLEAIEQVKEDFLEHMGKDVR